MVCFTPHLFKSGDFSIPIVFMRIKSDKLTIFFLVLLLILNTCMWMGDGFVYAQGEVPDIASEGAVLMDADSGEILYEKNASKRYYPASITKMMTALVVIENSGLDDTVVFSKSATTNLESGAVNLKVSAGDKISVRDCLYGLLLKSANEVANGLAEHTGGSTGGFASMMNSKAKALGCTNTNFVNPSGLNNNSHYTTARDMAIIAQACFNNASFRKINQTESYTFPAVKNCGSKVITVGHKMMRKSDSRYYEGIIGGKTGYTKKAGHTLVTGAQRDGKRLIVVILKSSSTHYEDTKKLLDYGFSKKTSSKSVKNPIENTNQPPELSNAVQSRTPVDPPDSGSASKESAYENMPYKTGWQRDDRGWYYMTGEKSWYASGIYTINGEKYYFDAGGYMLTGWQQYAPGDWYYMMDSGAVKYSSWLEYKGAWYYLGSDGKMLKDTKTPDGYYVDSSGVWVKN